MVFCNIWPRNTFVPLFLGSTVEAVGIGLLAWAMSTGKTATIYGMVAFSGVGTGLRFMPGTLHAVGFFPHSIATVISLMGIALPFGGALSLTIMTTVYNNLVAEGQEMAFVWAFVAICPFMGLCIVCAACLGNVGIVKPEPGEEGEGEAQHHITEGSYLLALLRGHKGAGGASETEKGETSPVLDHKKSTTVAISDH